jgi:molybdopterin biosynthesis enzyme
MVEDFTTQRITRLTPLQSVRSLIDAQIEAVKPQRSAIAATCGLTLAQDVLSPECPEHPIALRDGFAVEAGTIADASSYAPMPLRSPIRRIDTGEALPNGADAVLPLDAVTLMGGHAEAIASVTAGEGVLPAGGDIAPHLVLRRAGETMRSLDVAAMRAAGIKSALVREPRLAIALGSEPGTRPLDAAIGLLNRAACDAGAKVTSSPDITLDVAISDANNDAIITVGGTGNGRHDDAVRILAQHGRLELHGIAISPGTTAAFGFVGARPVLLMPGRLDAALALWLMIGRYLIAKLRGGKVDDNHATVPLKRKVSSAIGLAEVIPVASAGGMAEPLASGYLSLASLALSAGWIVVPDDSEGYAAGTPVAVRQWP